jgi:hypothetical protein
MMAIIHSDDSPSARVTIFILLNSSHHYMLVEEYTISPLLFSVFPLLFVIFSVLGKSFECF